MSQDPTVTTLSSQDHGLMERVSSPNAGNNLPSSAILVSSASLVNALAKARLPTNYIGVRRVRPSHRGLATPKTSADADAAAATSTTAATAATTATTIATTTRTTTSKVVFKVTNSDGSERRMNRQEKKALKQQLALERKTRAVERKNSQKRKAEELLAETVRSDPSDSSSNIVGPTSDASQTTACNYHQLSVNTAAMEQELAELRGERSGLPPVVLSPPLAWLARPHLEGMAAGTLPIVARIQYDAALSQEWATSIQQSMRPAEIVRDNEPNLRPMAYQLTPEPWTRLRVAASEEPLATSLSSHLPLDDSPSNPNLAATDDKNGHGRGHDHDHPKKDWTSMVCRPPSRLDWISTVVLEYLHRTQSNVHVSCGAKFGADLLVYDGPRDERHAFAGLRLLVPETRPATANNGQAASPSPSPSLPLVSTYTLSGYVRCLNTAGKLALLATVVVDEPNKVYRVALVDVALEKILTAPTHQRHARTNKRRDVSQNLAKHH